MCETADIRPVRIEGLFLRRALEIGIAPGADLQAAADPAEIFGAVGRDRFTADFAFIFAVGRHYDPGGAVGAFENLVGDNRLILVWVFSFHIDSGA